MYITPFHKIPANYHPRYLTTSLIFQLRMDPVDLKLLFSGILSAYGMALAQVVHEEQEPCALEFGGDETMHKFHQVLDRLSMKCTQVLTKQGFQPNQIVHEKFLHMRYQGTDSALMIKTDGGSDDYMGSFLKRYKTEFGFTLQNRSVLVDDVRVRGIGCTDLEFEKDETLSGLVL